MWEEKNKDWMIIENEKQLLKNNNNDNKFNSDLIKFNESENNNKYKNFKQSILFNNKFMKMRMKNKIKFFEDNLNN